MKGKWGGWAILAILALVVWGFISGKIDAKGQAAGADAPTSAEVKAAKKELAALTVRPESTKAGYSRQKFMRSWAPHGHGCDTRDVVLQSQGVGEHTTTGCKISCPSTAKPCWMSPYDGKQYRDPADLQVDHVVALAEAWVSGASKWPSSTREKFANDTDQLVAVDSHDNESKGDQDPGEWMPSHGGCRYAVIYVHTKQAYGLTIDSTERAALARVLGKC